MEEGPRTVLELVQFEGLSLRDAADRMDCTYAASKKRYARALESFRRALAEEGDPRDLA